jgi:hypothetical protein
MLCNKTMESVPVGARWGLKGKPVIEGESGTVPPL